MNLLISHIQEKAKTKREDGWDLFQDADRFGVFALVSGPGIHEVEAQTYNYSTKPS